MNHCHVCHAGVDKLEVRYDGKVVPCAAFKNPPPPFEDAFVLGDLTKGDTLADCLERGKRHVLLNMLKYVVGAPIPEEGLSHKVTEEDWELFDRFMRRNKGSCG